MDRLDKIFTILVMAGLIALLVNSRRSAATTQLNMSVAPSRDNAPAYLVSNLPIKRRYDDYADPVTYFQGLGGGGDLADAWGGSDGSNNG